MFAAGQCDPGACPCFEGITVLYQPVPYKLYADHEPPLSHLTHVSKFVNFCQALCQRFDLQLELLQRFFLPEEVDVRDGGSACQGVAGVSMSVEKGPEFTVFSEKTAEDLFVVSVAASGR